MTTNLKNAFSTAQEACYVSLFLPILIGDYLIRTIYNSQVLEATEVPISKRVDPKTMVYLHNGILRSGEKERAYALCNSMDETGEHYAK